IGTADTFNTTGISYTLTCIYRISLKSGGNYGIQYAKIKNKIVQPFYFKTNISSNDEDVRFTDIAIIGTNEFYVTRQGNSSLTSSGPDQAVLLFNHADKFITPVAISSSGTLYRDFFKKPIGITTLC